MSNWNDDMMDGFKRTFGFLQTVFYERGQLYGSLIQSMLESGQTEFTLTQEMLRNIGDNYYILFTPNQEEHTLKVELKRQENENNEAIIPTGTE